jgi:hypothetical protein
MTKILIATLVPVVLLGLLIISASWFLARKNDRVVQELTKACIDRGYIPTSSTENGFLSSHVTFSCVKGASSASTQ